MQKKIKGLVEKYINERENKKLLELAFECEDKKIIHKIADYYIQEKDVFNICELLSITSNFIDLDYIFDEIVKTKDTEFIFYISKNGVIRGLIDKEYFLKLEN